MSHRARRLSSARLASGANRPASPLKPSIRDRTQAERPRLLVARCAALISVTIAGMSTPAAQSIRHWWQLKQVSAIARTASPESSFGSSRPERSDAMRFAFARGDDSSAASSRYLGHIRTAADCVRQAPQPLQASTSSASFPGDQLRTGRTVSGAALAAGSAAAAFTATSAGRNATGSAPARVILPGLRMPKGSKSRFTSANTAASSGKNRSKNAVRESPSPCSPPIVPPTATTSA